MRGQKSSPGDTRIAKNKYHYTCTPDGWVLTHRMLVESDMDRDLRPNERVKFLDGDRTNLDLSNLEVYRVRQKTRHQRIAHLEARIEELTAELEELQALDTLENT